MSFRLLLDEDIDLKLAPALRKTGYDALHIQEAGRKGKSDEEQLAFAASRQSAILTHNVIDYIHLHNRYVELESIHFGIIVAKRSSFSSLYHKVLRLLESEN